MTALLLVAAGGCGGDEDEPGGTVRAEPGTTVPVIGDEYSFDPETIVVRGGGELLLALTNDGVLAHNLRVFDGGSDIGGMTTFTGGKTRTATLTLDQGDYELVCTVGNHAELGMVGTLRVE